MIDKNNDPRKGMKVPDGFFDSFEDQIMEELAEKKMLTFWSRRRLMKIAAVFIILLACIFVIEMNRQSDDATMAELSDELQWDYLFDNYEDLTFDEIAQFDESEEAIYTLENELYGNIADEIILEDVDLETIENLYE